MDNQTIAAAQQGDIAAFNEIYREFAPRVYAWMHRLAPQLAEDLVQETFLKVYKNLKTYAAQSKFSTWLYRAAMNCALNELKKNRPAVSASQEWPEIADPGPDPEKRMEDKDLAGKLLAGLPEEQKSLVMLADLLDLDYTEMAQILSLPLGTIKSRLARARDRMRALAKEWNLDLSAI